MRILLVLLLLSGMVSAEWVDCRGKVILYTGDENESWLCNCYMFKDETASFCRERNHGYYWVEDVKQEVVKKVHHPSPRPNVVRILTIDEK